MLRILGPVEAWADDQPVMLGGRRQLALLVFLVLHANSAVSSDALIDAVWGSDRDGAVDRLHVAVARLRRALRPLAEDGRAVLRTVGGGYHLTLPPGALDADLFEWAVRDGRDALREGDPTRAAERLREALALWRGQPLADVAFQDFAGPEIRRLEELHLLACESRIEAELQLGRHTEVLGDLESLLEREPTHERLAELLMLALYRCGRQADALGVYERTRRHLDEELGLKPSRHLSSTQRAVLEHAVPLDAQQTAPDAAAAESTYSTRRSGLSVGDASHTMTSDQPPPSDPQRANRREADDAILPAGVVTMVFTIMEGSTRLVQTHSKTYGRILARHDQLLHEIFVAHGGVEAGHTDEGLLFAFTSTVAALGAASAAQTAIRNERWPDGVDLRIRVGVHTGEPRQQGSTYWGECVHYGARVASAAAGGQILVSEATAAVAPGSDLHDLGRHRLKDFPVPRQIYQAGGSRFAPLRTANPLRSNLPSSGEKLISRQQECATLVEMLKGLDPRLVTITGPGGTGKTRLGLAVAETMVEMFSDGAFFVALAEIDEADRVLPTIANVLGVGGPDGGGASSALGAAIVDREMLLVLDSFEHLLSAGRDVTSLLRDAPQLRVLVTSQAPLRVRPEHVFALKPLEVPRGSDRKSVSAAPAAQMLIDRATHTFELTDKNASSVAGICTILGGLPLAIELAAARLDVLSAPELMGRLQHGVDALGSGPRDLPPRQRGLRAALDWTCGLLGEDEATMLRRLSVFAGPSSVDRVEQVCLEPGQDGLDALTGLIDLSLVSRQGDGRVGMHATVRDYARGRLVAAGEADGLQRRHAEVFAAAAEDWGKTYLLAVHEVQSAVLAEETNLAEALAWAVDEDVECFARIVGGVAPPLLFTGRLPRWSAVVEEMAGGAQMSPTAAAWLRLAAGLVAVQRNDIDLAHARMADAITAADQTTDPMLACAIQTLSVVAQALTDATDETWSAYDALMRRSSELGDGAYLRLVQGLKPHISHSQNPDAPEVTAQFEALMRDQSRTDYAATTAIYAWPDRLLDAGLYGKALKAYGLAYTAAYERLETPLMAYQIEGLVLTLSALDRHAEALEAVGWAQAMRRTVGPAVSKFWIAKLDDATQASRAAVGKGLADAALLRGGLLTMEGAVNASLEFVGRLARP